jgi:hypothetical protein
MMGRRLIPLLGGLLLLAAGASAAPAPAPITVAKGETAPDIVVSFATPVVVDGTAANGVFVAGADLTVTGRVEGDVAVMGGRLVVPAGGRVRGKVFLVGSTSAIDPAGRIEGKLFTMPFLGRETQALFANPADFILSVNYDFGFIAKRIFFALFWFLLAITLGKLRPAHVNFACTRLKSDPGYTAGLGVVGIAGGALLLMVALALSLIFVGIPLVVLLLVFLLAAWAFGMVVLFYAVGDKVLRLFRHAAPSPLAALVTATLLWTAIKFLPGVSQLVSLAAVVFSIGITIATRFGTGVPWLGRHRKPAPRPAGARPA